LSATLRAVLPRKRKLSATWRSSTKLTYATKARFGTPSAEHVAIAA
jgi:hypothetical protein